MGNKTNHPRGRRKPLPEAPPSVIERRPSVDELVRGIGEASPMKVGIAKDAALLQLRLCMQERERLYELSATGKISIEEATAANANHRAFLKLLETLGVDGKRDPDEDVEFGA